MAYNSALGYDPDKDYSAALQNQNLSATERAQLTKEREAKINKVYGGVEPTLYGSNQTYSQAYNSNGVKKTSTPSTTSTPSGSTLVTPSSSYGVNYYSNTYVDGTNETDWSKAISNAIIEGKPASVVQAYLDQRNAKIKSDPSLSKYANDQLTQIAEQYILNNSQSTDSMIEDLKGLYSGTNSVYSTALKNSQAVTDASVQKAVNDLEAQKNATNQSYSDLLKQLYIDKMKSKKNIDQQLASQGITGGMSENALLGLDTSYSEALRQGETSRINAIDSLDRAITDTKLDGDISKATAALEAAQKNADSYASILQALISRNDTLDYNNTALERENDSIIRQQDQNAKTSAYNLAIQMITNGVMPTSDVLLTAGISQADAQSLVDSVKASQVKSSAAGTPTLTLTEAKKLADDGYLGDEVINVLKSNGYTDNMIESVYGESKLNTAAESDRQTIIDSGYVGADGKTISSDNWNAILISNPNVTEEYLYSLGFVKGNTTPAIEPTPTVNSTNVSPASATLTPWAPSVTAPSQLLSVNATNILNNILSKQKSEGRTELNQAEIDLLWNSLGKTITENDLNLILDLLGYEV